MLSNCPTKIIDIDQMIHCAKCQGVAFYLPKNKKPLICTNCEEELALYAEDLEDNETMRDL